MRSTLALLLLFGPPIVAATACELYKLPKTGECEIEIEWRVHNDKQALATCLEYFPTTFVKGVQSGNKKDKVKCTVSAAYDCPRDGDFLLYDKCYSFMDASGTVNGKKKISEYLKTDAQTKKRIECPSGKLAAVYSSTHAKFLGMEANRRGVDKLGIGMTTDGMTIDEENGKKSMLHKKMWKLIDGDYWNGDKLVKAPVVGDKPDYPATANYLFMRTQTDHMHNRIQGSFERATADVVVTFACESPAVFTEHQQWYCDKLGEKGLGLDAVYDDDSVSPRCLYLTASKYTFSGDFSDTKNIKGCQERPSDLHSAGMDDGTGTAKKYYKFKFHGAMRLAAARVEAISSYGAVHTQKPCEGKEKDSGKLENYRRQFLYFDHHGKKQFPALSRLTWGDYYPRKECADFPDTSIGATAALKNGEYIEGKSKIFFSGLMDMPKEVRARAVCSLRFFQECENTLAKTGETPCGKKLVCKNEKTYQTDTSAPVIKEGFFTCACPGKGEAYEQTVENGNIVCTWKGEGQHCAWLYFYRTKDETHKNTFFFEPEDGSDKGKNFIYDRKFGPDLPNPGKTILNDKLQRVVVREGCKMTVNSKRSIRDKRANNPLTPELGYGEHPVPNEWDGSLGGDAQGWGASSAKCSCD